MYSKDCKQPAVRSFLKQPSKAAWKGLSRRECVYTLATQNIVGLEKIAYYYSMDASDVLDQLLYDYLSMRQHIIKRVPKHIGKKLEAVAT